MNILASKIFQILNLTKKNSEFLFSVYEKADDDMKKFSQLEL